MRASDQARGRERRGKIRCHEPQPVAQPCYQEGRCPTGCSVTSKMMEAACQLTGLPLISTCLCYGFFSLPLKVQLLAHRNNNNHIFFPGREEEMQTTSFQVEEKNRLDNSETNLQAGGQTMLKPISGFWKAEGATGRADPGAVDTREGFGVPRGRTSPTLGSLAGRDGAGEAAEGAGGSRTLAKISLWAEFSSSAHPRANARLCCKAPVPPHGLSCQTFNYTVRRLFSLTRCRAVLQGVSCCCLTEGRKLPPSLGF